MIHMNKTAIDDLMEDIIKVITVIFISHTLFFTIDGEGEFMSEKMIKTLLYTIISLSVYHFLIKKLIKLK